MKILYSPVGDTDPIRNFRDGGVLHIVRHYQIDMAVLFLSAEMAEKENMYQFYSKPIKYTAPDCQISFIKTDITDAHHMESLTRLADEFIELRKKYPNAEFYLNLSSGTPQMKTIMAFLANDFPDVTAVQVDTPMKGSNRSNHAVQNKDDIDTIVELNEDNDALAENRCHETSLDTIRRYGIRQQIMSLIKSYEYGGALAIYKQNKRLFTEDTGKFLQEANERKQFIFRNEADQQAFHALGKTMGLSAEKCKLNEFLMLLELYEETGQLTDFVIKLNVFMYELGKFYLFNNLNLKKEWIFDDAKNQNIIKRVKLQEYYPSILAVLDKKFGYFRDCSLSFSNIIGILSGVSYADAKLLKIFEDLKHLIPIRNDAAHTITIVRKDTLKARKPFLTSKEIVEHAKKAFNIVLPGIYRNNIYRDKFNKKIQESMEHFAK